MNANDLRSMFLDFFVERGHTLVPSSGLIPHHPLAPLFTNAGMNQFLPYLLGEETPSYPRATSVQKCVRVRGKHDDIELIGRTTRHLSFFEMLGQWSFGDYFKEGAIKLAWELVTEKLKLDADRVWVTVHETDDEAAAIWESEIGLPAERIQRMGADNFWEMGDTGPCGPCSELYYDRGPDYGPDGGPAPFPPNAAPSPSSAATPVLSSPVRAGVAAVIAPTPHPTLTHFLPLARTIRAVFGERQIFSGFRTRT